MFLEIVTPNHFFIPLRSTSEPPKEDVPRTAYHDRDCTISVILLVPFLLFSRKIYAYQATYER